MAGGDPYLDDSIRGYIVKTARKEFWKVSSWYELDDLIQDGYLCFAKCRARVKTEGPPTKDDRRQFMAFFMMAYRNHIIDLQKSLRARRQELVAADFADDTPLENWAESAATFSDAPLAGLLAAAPAEILELVKLILVDGVADAPYLRTKTHRETTVEHFDRCLGRPGVVEKLRQYLAPA